MSRDYDGLVVAVTGASSGLGRAISIAVAEAGAAAVMLGYAGNADGAMATKALVEAAGAEAIVVQADVADDTACVRFADEARRFDRVDALFNNAGATVFAANHGDMAGLSADDFLAVYRVNVVGVYQMVRALRSLLEAGIAPGAVVNISSASGITGNGTSVAYAASKGALNTMTLSLARALAPRIRVNGVLPGYIDTDWWAKGMEADALVRLRERAAGAAALRVASTANDIAAAAIFLGSPASRHVTGQNIVVDAGVTLGTNLA